MDRMSDRVRKWRGTAGLWIDHGSARSLRWARMRARELFEGVPAKLRESSRTDRNERRLSLIAASNTSTITLITRFSCEPMPRTKNTPP